MARAQRPFEVQTQLLDFGWVHRLQTDKRKEKGTLKTVLKGILRENRMYLKAQSIMMYKERAVK
jgi:hypothetical protein